MANRFTHDPNADLDYSVDWTEWMYTDDTINASTWTITPTGPTLTNSTFDDTTTTVWVDGGTGNVTYTLTNHITTADGREDDRSILLSCVER